MIEIESSSGLIYHPRLQQDYPVIDALLQLELNKAGSLTFTLPPSHPHAGQLYKLSTECWVKRDGEELWRGRVLYSDRDLSGCREFCCEGLRTVLNDEALRPTDLSSDGTYTGTAAGLIDLCITAYNSRNPQAVPFSRGTVSNFGTITAKAEDYVKIGEFLDDIVETFGGFLRVRRVNGYNQIDYTAQSGSVNGQTIRFGENILDMQEHVTGEDVFNVVIPLGKEQDEGEGRLTIETAQSSGGNDYIENQAAVTALGHRIVKIVTFNDIEDPDELYAAGAACFDQGGGMVTSIKLSAVDLHAANVSTSALRLGDTNLISIPYLGIEMLMPMTKCSIDLLDAENESYTFGVTMTTLSEAQARSRKAIAATMDRASASATPAQVNAMIASSEARQADFVIETGSNGIWTWRKWNSGVAECTGTASINLTSTAMSSVGSEYYASTTEAYPLGLFISAPTVHVSANAGGTLFWAGQNVSSQASNTAKYTIFTPIRLLGSQTFNTTITAIGRWK